MGSQAANFDGRAPAAVPLGLRLLLLVSVLCELVFLLEPLSVYALFDGHYVHSLFFAPYTYGTAWSLLACVVVGYPRLRHLEYESGTLGGMLVFYYTSLALSILHLFTNAVFSLAVSSTWYNDFNGAWAIVGLLYGIDARSDFHEKKLVIGGYPIIAGMMPIIILFVSWLFSWGFPTDVLVGVSVGCALGELVLLPDFVFEALESIPETTAPLAFLLDWPSFVARRSGGFKKLLPQYNNRPENGVFAFDDALQPDSPHLIDTEDVSGGAGRDLQQFGGPTRHAELLGYNRAYPSDDDCRRLPADSYGGGRRTPEAANNAYERRRRMPEEEFPRDISIAAPPGTAPAPRSYATVSGLLEGGASPRDRGNWNSSQSPPPLRQAVTAIPSGNREKPLPPINNPSAKVFTDIPAPGGRMPDFLGAQAKDPFDFEF